MVGAAACWVALAAGVLDVQGTFVWQACYGSWRRHGVFKRQV
jgi:hypothetical protein